MVETVLLGLCPSPVTALPSGTHTLLAFLEPRRASAPAFLIRLWNRVNLQQAFAGYDEETGHFIFDWVRKKYCFECAYRVR